MSTFIKLTSLFFIVVMLFFSIVGIFHILDVAGSGNSIPGIQTGNNVAKEQINANKDVETQSVEAQTADSKTTETFIIEEKNTDSEIDALQNILIGAQEVNSPYDRIRPEDIQIIDDKVIIKIDHAYLSQFTDTNSMDPVLDIEANAIQVMPSSQSDIHIGDIISYETPSSTKRIIHRVIEIGEDEQGWYARAKGDNLKYVDPQKVRFDQIKRIVVGVIY